MPEDAALAIAIGTGGADGGFDGFLDREELVILGDLLLDGGAIVFEDDVAADELEEAGRFEDALDEGAEGIIGRSDFGTTIGGFPGGEALFGREDAAHFGLETVGDDFELVVAEECRDLGMVGLELVPGLLQIGPGIVRVFQFEEGEGKAIDEDDDIGPAIVGAIENGELIDDEEVVLGGVIPIDELDGFAAGFAIDLDFDLDALLEELVDVAIGMDQVGMGRLTDLADGLIDGGRRGRGVQAIGCGAEASGEEDILMGSAFGRNAAGRKIGTGDIGIAEVLQPDDCCFLDCGFVEFCCNHCTSHLCSFAANPESKLRASARCEDGMIMVIGSLDP